MYHRNRIFLPLGVSVEPDPCDTSNVLDTALEVSAAITYSDLKLR